MLQVMCYLHPTMYLLIHCCRCCSCYCNCHLHPTMYLLIRTICRRKITSGVNLHPTMYLLILNSTLSSLGVKQFTSHYVSINSAPVSAMLIIGNAFTSHYVSINSSLKTRPLSWFQIYIPLCIY